MARQLGWLGRMSFKLNIAWQLFRLWWGSRSDGSAGKRPSPAELALVMSMPVGHTTVGEIRQTCQALQECCVQHRGFCSMELDPALEWFDSAVGDCDGLRQTGLGLPTGASWSVEMIRAIQTEMLSKFKNWSVVIEHPVEERSLVIFRKEVQLYATDAPVADLPTFLAENGRLQDEWTAANLAWKDRQLEELRRRIPRPLPVLTDEKPFQLVAIFDRDRATKYWSLHLLVDANSYDLSITIPGHEPTAGRTSYLTADGTLYPRSRYFKDGRQHEVEAAYRIESNLIPADYQGPTLEVYQTDNDQNRLRTWTLPFDPAQVIRDAELRRRLS